MPGVLSLAFGMRNAHHIVSMNSGAAMSTVEKMTIALTPEMAGFIRNAVAAGEYASTSEAIRHAVREWKERRDLLGYTVEELREFVREGLDGGPGTYASMDAIKAEARRRLEAIAGGN